MQVDVSAQVSKVTVKPPKSVQGVRVGPPLVQVVLEIEGTAQVANLACLVNQEVEVTLDSPQATLDDALEMAAATMQANRREHIQYARTLGE